VRDPSRRAARRRRLPRPIPAQIAGKLPEVGLELRNIHAIGGHECLHHGIGKSLSQRHVGPTTIAVSLPDRAAGISISHVVHAPS
jgi:hypothetical protein